MSMNGFLNGFKAAIVDLKEAVVTVDPDCNDKLLIWLLGYMNSLYEIYKQFQDDENKRAEAESKLKEALSYFDDYSNKCKTDMEAQQALEKWLEDNKGNA